ncbi:MAG: T9SS type A sorting domain-containing protein [Bacteroidetes bacterium]|nr:T9SS type A sorting domain-containing protein [Bacteroidota bacterium]
MKTLLALVFFIFTITLKSQCAPSTFPTDIYYPNSSSTPTNVSGPEYLCGPNTIVYDTVEIGCRFVYVNPFCTLYFKPTLSCAAASYIWLKSNSTLNLAQGSGPTFVFYESGAIINNPFAVTISSQTCTSITFPTINCSPTSLIKEDFKIWMQIYPNPASEILNVNLSTAENNSRIEILNCYGQAVVKENIVGYNIRIPVNNMPNGIYTLNLISLSSRTSKRFVVSK